MTVVPTPSDQPRLLVYFGDSELGAATQEVRTSVGIHEVASAELALDLTVVGDVTIDYLAPVRVVAEYSGQPYPLFTGNVLEVTLEGDTAHVRCSAAPALQENLAPPLAFADVPAVEIIYLSLRELGFGQEQMALDGLDELPVERFEVAVPVDGLHAADEYTVGGVSLRASAPQLAELDWVEAGTELAERFFGAPVYAHASDVGTRGYDVEQAVLARIDTALAWLGIRAIYGLARLPSGDPVAFRRALTRARPERRRVVLVRGLETGRRWLREVGTTSVATALPLDDPSWSRPALPLAVSEHERQALLACWRAITEEDALGRVVALWEAVEFYAAKTKVPDLFTKAELEAIRRELPDGLSAAQRERVEARLAEMNTPSLMARLEQALSDDGVPLAEGEAELLRRLRRLRNAAVHGRGSELPRMHELERATSLISRMLVFRMEASGARGGRLSVTKLA